MALTQYLALLRGINVGGNNLIKIPALKASFETMGFGAVATYIQSGNVLFEASGADAAELVRQIERALSEAFRYRSTVVLRSRRQMRDVVARAPRGFGEDPGQRRYDVIFLKEPLSAAQAMKSVTAKEGVDEAFPGDGVLYFTRLISKATQSRLGRIAGLPIYRQITIRNWNTTTKLEAMMQSRDRGA